MTAVAISILAGGLVIFLVSLPLACRKIPMNHLYGIRIRASFESDSRWYDINAYGGRQMAGWSSVIIATGLVGFFVPREYFPTYSWASIPVTLAAVLVPTIRIYQWSQSPDHR